MHKSKILSVFNNSFYILIALVLLFININYLSIISSLTGFIYLLFLIKKNYYLFLCTLCISSLYLIKYNYEYNELFNIRKNDYVICTIDSIPNYKNSKVKFYCKTQKNFYLIEGNQKNDKLKIGQVVKIYGVYREINHNTVPNQFDYADYLLSKKIGYKIKVEKIIILNEFSNANYWLINKIIEYYRDLEFKEYVYSLIIGYKDSFSDDFNEDIKSLNISHLFVVSGFHVGFLYMILSFILKYLKITRERSQIFIFIILFIYLAINNYASSILRAVLFIVSIKINQKYNLKFTNINLLSFICILNLFINPFLLFNSGFNLSYLITLTLILSKNLINKKNIYTIFKINFIANIFSIPIVANFSFYYNFISFFLSPILCVLYLLVIFPISLMLIICKKLEFLLTYFFIFYEKLLSFLNEINYLIINIGFFNQDRLILYFMILFIIFSSIEQKKKIIFYLVLLFLNLFLYYKLSLVDEVTYIDVTYGDSIFINSSLNNCTALIDTGGMSINNNYFHPGNNVLKYLQSIQISSIDYLFISHSDHDHAGDYKIIIDNIKVNNIVYSSYDNSSLLNEIKYEANIYKINLIELKAYNIVNCGNLDFHVLSPLVNNNNINDNSLVLLFNLNNDSFLFTGDISSDVEEEIVRKYKLNIDFLKISHHGSKYSTSENLIRKFGVKNAIISVGYNYYNHPANTVLSLLEDEYVNYYRTDYHGTVSIKYLFTKRRRIQIFPA